MRPLIRCTLILATVGAFAATFFLPTTRETQMLTWRMLLHRPVANTTISADSPGRPVPDVSLSDEFRSHVRAAQGRSPEAYILAQCASAAVSAFPPAEQWRSHPAARWAVLHEAGRIWIMRPTSYLGTPLPGSDVASAEAIENTLATTRMLQLEHPQEGELWLAEAVVLFACGDDIAGLQSIWSAINRNSWASTSDQRFEVARALLQSSGLPRLEATQVAGWSGRPEPQRGVLLDAGDALLVLLAQAVHDGEDAKVEELLITLTALSEVGRKSIHLGLAIETRGSYDELVSAMAGRVGMVPPAREEFSDYEDMQKARWQIVTAYLGIHVSPEAAALFVDENTREKDAADCRWSEHASPWSGAPLVPGVAGAATLFLLSLLASALIAEIPFLVAPPSRQGSRDVFPAGFLLVLMPAFAVMVLAWFISFQALGFSQDVTVKARAFLPREYVAVLVAAVFSLGVAGFRRLLVWHPGWYRAAWLSVFVLYLAVLWKAGEIRIAETQRLAFPPWW